MHFVFLMFPPAGRETAIISRKSWISEVDASCPFWSPRGAFSVAFQSSETEREQGCDSLLESA